MTTPSASVGTQPNARGSPTRTRCSVTSAPLSSMAVQQRAQVGARQHVAVEHHRGVVPQLGRHVGDAAAGAQRLVLDDVVDLQAELGPVAELRLEHRRLVRGAQHDVLDARRGDPRQQVGQERQPGGRQHRLGCRQRQRPQPGALTADQNDGVHLRRVDGPLTLAVLSPAYADGLRDHQSATRASSAPLIVHRSGACHRFGCRSARKV